MASVTVTINVQIMEACLRQTLQHIFSNPLLVREMHRSPQPTLRSAFIRSFVASAALGYFMGIWLNPQSRIITLIVVILGASTFFIPPIVAFMSALITLNDLNSRHFDLIRLTTISDAQLVQGYVASTCYRCRLLFSAAIAFAPLLFIRIIVVTTHETYFRCLVSSILVSPCSLLPSLSTIFSFFSIFMVLGVNILALSLLSAALGVLLAGLWRNAFFSSLSALFLSLLTVGILILIAFTSSDIRLIFGSLAYLAIAFGLYVIVFQASRPLIRNSR